MNPLNKDICVDMTIDVLKWILCIYCICAHQRIHSSGYDDFELFIQQMKFKYHLNDI